MFNKLPFMYGLLKWVLNFEACLSAYPYYHFVKFLLLACAFIFPVCIFHHLGYYIYGLYRPIYNP